MNKMYCDTLSAVNAFISDLMNNPAWDGSEPTVHCYSQVAQNGKTYVHYYVVYRLKGGNN